MNRPGYDGDFNRHLTADEMTATRGDTGAAVEIENTSVIYLSWTKEGIVFVQGHGRARGAGNTITCTLSISVAVPLTSGTFSNLYSARTFTEVDSAQPSSCYCYASTGTSNTNFNFKMEYAATTNLTRFDISPRVLKLRYSNANNGVI